MFSPKCTNVVAHSLGKTAINSVKHDVWLEETSDWLNAQLDDDVSTVSG